MVCGTPQAYNESMINLLTWLSRRRFPYEPLITVELSRKRLLGNLAEFKKIAPHHKVAPVLKSNAYGHGLIEVASILEKDNRRLARAYGWHDDRVTPFFIVDSFFEALALRSNGITTPLLIIGFTRPEIMLSSNLRDVMFTATSLDTLRSIRGTQDQIYIHLKIDTGMRRQGLLPHEIDDALEIINGNDNIVVDGICTHFSDADNEDPSFTEGQIKLWNRLSKHIRPSLPFLKFVHVSNTDGHRYTVDIDANVSRLGIGLYGLVDGASFSPKLDLHPVLEMKTIITGTKLLERGETVGYGNSFRSEHAAMTIATIPAGYFEGIDRRLSNLGTIQVGSERAACPIVGRVSMNITTIDISHDRGVRQGEPVTVISGTATDLNSIQSMAKKCGTIPYEIAVHIAGHLRRKIVS